MEKRPVKRGLRGLGGWRRGQAESRECLHCQVNDRPYDPAGPSYPMMKGCVDLAQLVQCCIDEVGACASQSVSQSASELSNNTNSGWLGGTIPG